MAIGYSLGGLVAALKSAAFRAIGLNLGDVPEVGALGLFAPATPFKSGFNWSTYAFRNGEILYVEGASAVNWPFDFSIPKDEYVLVEVVGISDVGQVELLVKSMGAKRSPVFVTRRPNGTFEIASVVTTRKMDDTQSLNAMSDYLYIGEWHQAVNANCKPELGYPIALAGVLKVQFGPYGCTQTYTAHIGGEKYFRYFMSGGPWSPWAKYTMEGLLANHPGLELTDKATPFINFRYQGNMSGTVGVQLVNSAAYTLAISAIGAARPIVDNQGWYSANGVYGMWGMDWATEQTAYRVRNMNVGGGEVWVPFLSGQTVKNIGYISNVGYGQYVSSGNFFGKPTINMITDANKQARWIFNYESGQITGQNLSGNNFTLPNTDWVNGRVNDVMSWANGTFYGRGETYTSATIEQRLSDIQNWVAANFVNQIKVTAEEEYRFEAGSGWIQPPGDPSRVMTNIYFAGTVFGYARIRYLRYVYGNGVAVAIQPM